MKTKKLISIALAIIMALSSLPAVVFADTGKSVKMTDCGHFTGADWSQTAPVFSAGWDYNDISPNTIESVKVFAVDKNNDIVVEYNADKEQIKWQIDNNYITEDGLSSVPFYKDYQGTLLSEERDDDWTATKGKAFEMWQPVKFGITVQAEGEVYTDSMVYNYDYPGIDITDCGHFTGADWAGKAGAYSVGWKYTALNTENITSIRVGAKDAKDRTVMEYTADKEQIDWQLANGYITADGLSSAPFYKENNGEPIKEGRDNDWTVAKGEGFDTWQPTLFYVEVKVDGVTYYDEMVYNFAYPSVEMTDCGHFAGADWAGPAGAYSAGWKYSNIDFAKMSSIKVGAKDAKDRTVMEYTADKDQIAWQQANGYITADGLSSAPFYKENNGEPIKEGRDNDWTAKKGSGFADWQPTLFYVEAVVDGVTFYDEMNYDYQYPALNITDCGHFTGADWAGKPGAYSVGWKYSNFKDNDKIISIKVGAKDAAGKIVMEYTADEKQIAWQQANGYITADGLSSAPFYKESKGKPIVEGRDDDWTVAKGEAFDLWQPALFYVEVKTAGAAYYDEMVYNFAYPDVEMTDCGHFTGADWAGEAGAYSMGWKYFNVDKKDIESLKVGAKDAKDRIVMEYNAVGEQIAYQKANGYVTETGLSSAPFYKDYKGTPIKEQDEDWTVTKGKGFDTWQPTLFYVEVVVDGVTYYDEMPYNYNYPHVHEAEKTEAKAATCTEDGNIAYWYCADCGKYFSDEEFTEEITLEDTVVSKGHIWEADFTVDKEATCTENGSKSIHCENCNETKEVTVIDALGHDFGEWETVTSPNCTDKGSEKHTCSRCDFFETRDLDELGHTWEADFTVDKEATCTEDGSKSIHCEKCDAAKDSTVIPATGHTGGEATCKDKAVCETCGDAYGDVDHDNHVGGTEVKNAKDATCTEEGYTGDKVCKGCGEILEKGEATGKIAHDYQDGKCSVCGKEQDVIYGDVNNDKKVDATDALWVLQHSVELRTLTETELKAADVTDLGKVDPKDALQILQKTVELIDQFDVEKK